MSIENKYCAHGVLLEDRCGACEHETGRSDERILPSYAATPLPLTDRFMWWVYTQAFLLLGKSKYWPRIGQFLWR